MIVHWKYSVSNNFFFFFISHTTTTTYNWYNEIILLLRTLNHIANLLSFLGVCSSVCEGHGGARKVSNDYNCLLPRCYGIHSYVWRHKWRILQQRPWLVSVCVSSTHSLPYVLRLQKRHGFMNFVGLGKEIKFYI